MMSVPENERRTLFSRAFEIMQDDCGGYATRRDGSFKLDSLRDDLTRCDYDQSWIEELLLSIPLGVIERRMHATYDDFAAKRAMLATLLDKAETEDLIRWLDSDKISQRLIIWGQLKKRESISDSEYSRLEKLFQRYDVDSRKRIGRLSGAVMARLSKVAIERRRLARETRGSASSLKGAARAEAKSAEVSAKLASMEELTSDKLIELITRGSNAKDGTLGATILAERVKSDPEKCVAALPANMHGRKFAQLCKAFERADRSEECRPFVYAFLADGLKPSALSYRILITDDSDWARATIQKAACSKDTAIRSAVAQSLAKEGRELFPDLVTLLERDSADLVRRYFR